MTYPNDPNVQRDLEPQSSMTTTTWVGLAFVLLLFSGLAFWAYQSGETINTASKRPGIEKSVPPTTTGQGGGVSRMQDGAK